MICLTGYLLQVVHPGISISKRGSFPAKHEHLFTWRRYGTGWFTHRWQYNAIFQNREAAEDAAEDIA